MEKQIDKLRERQIEIFNRQKDDIILPKEIEKYYWNAIFNNIQGRYLEAWDEFQKSYEILKKNKKSEGLFYIYIGMGLIAKEMEDYMGALDFFDRAGAILRKYPDEKRYCILQNNIGEIYLCIRSYRKAIVHFNRVNNLKGKKDKGINGIELLNLGIAYRKLGKLKKARQYLESALEIMKDRKYYKERELVYENLVCIEYQLKNYRKVVFYLAKVLDYMDTSLYIEGRYEEKGELLQILYELEEEDVLIKWLWNDYQKNEKANRHSNCRVICDMAIFYVIKKDSKELLSVLYDKYHYHSKKYGELVKEYQKKSAGFQRKI